MTLCMKQLEKKATKNTGRQSDSAMDCNRATNVSLRNRNGAGTMSAQYYRHKCTAKYHYYRCISCGRKASRENPIVTSQGECRDCLIGMEEDRQEWAAYEYQQQHPLA